MKIPMPFRLLCLALASLPATLLWSQEVERDLQFVPTSDVRTALSTSTRGGGSLTLPFFDDFASPTFAVEDGPAGSSCAGQMRPHAGP